jgi:hypothetical protein
MDDLLDEFVFDVFRIVIDLEFVCGCARVFVFVFIFD